MTTTESPLGNEELALTLDELFEKEELTTEERALILTAYRATCGQWCEEEQKAHSTGKKPRTSKGLARSSKRKKTELSFNLNDLDLKL